MAGMFLVNFVGSFAAVGALLPTLKHWNNHCSYADTIMPQFLFAVGIGFRMSFVARRQRSGGSVDYGRIVRRILGLLLVALVIHQLDGHYGSWEQMTELGLWGILKNSFQQNYFQTLAHIGLASLWVVPVIGAGGWARLIYLVLSAAAFSYLSSWWYYDWVLTRPGIDGGPLGFMTWSTPLLLGTLAYDWWQHRQRTAPAIMLVAGGLSMILGYGVSCLSTVTYPNSLPTGSGWADCLADYPWVRPAETASVASDAQAAPASHDRTWWNLLTIPAKEIPVASVRYREHWVHARNAVWNEAKRAGGMPQTSVPADVPMEKWHQAGRRYLNMWTMNQRAGSWSYMLFGGGLSLVLLAACIVICDQWGWQLGMFRTLGVNALFAYILHGMVNSAVRPFVPNDAPLWYVFAGFGVSLGICYLVLRTLEKRNIIFRL
ncbi:MAG: hypothetical protein KF752_04495 [Pirellulaceae bacterium]|nr:hypothetical protein [Pirellulaceae bacterium]